MLARPADLAAALALVLSATSGCSRPTSTPAAVPAPTAAPSVMPMAAIAESEPAPSVEAPQAKRKARSSLPEPVLRELYACWLENPYAYMFDAPHPDARGPEIEGVGEAGMFMSGIGGIMDYGSLSTCMGRIAGVKKTSYSAMNTVEAFADMTVGVPGAKYEDPMSLNVDLVRWGRASLIPEPTMLVLGNWTAGELYRVMFRRFFRLMAHTYLALKLDRRINGESKLYFAATRGGHDGLDYLENRFAGQLQSYGGSYDGTQWTPAMSFGFWMRREADGTAYELWLGLNDLLGLYDAAWLDTMRSEYGARLPTLFDLPS